MEEKNLVGDRSAERKEPALGASEIEMQKHLTVVMLVSWFWGRSLDGGMVVEGWVWRNEDGVLRWRPRPKITRARARRQKKDVLDAVLLSREKGLMVMGATRWTRWTRWTG